MLDQVHAGDEVRLAAELDGVLTARTIALPATALRALPGVPLSWLEAADRSAHGVHEPAYLGRTCLGVFHNARVAELREHDELRCGNRGVDRLGVREW